MRLLITLKISNDKTMKIAIIGTRGYPYVYSGYETFVSELAPRLTNAGHQIYVYCHKSLFKSYPKVVNGINLVYLPAIERKSLSQFTHSFLSTIHAIFKNYDILLYVNSANGPFGFLTKLFKRKTAINVDGLEWLRPKWKGLGSKYYYWASKLSTRLFDMVISDSTEMAKIYKKEFNADSVTIAYGANIGYSENGNMIKQFNLKKNEYYLIVGRLIPDNNADLIVKGFCASNSNKKLVIVGDVPYNDSYAENIRKVNDERIVFTGYVRDSELLKELYCNAYVYIHGHEFGGTNPTLLKALACGTPILALNTVFSKEILVNGEYGFFFEKNKSSLTTRIEEIDSQNGFLDCFRTKNRKRILEKYTWDIITEQYITLFNKMYKNN